MQGYYFKTPFASNGDRVTIPLTTQADGSVSFAQGWGPDYQKNLKTQSTAKAVSRQVTNQVLYALSASVGALQEMGGVPEYITAEDNGGTAFSYGAGAQVIYKGVYYVSLQAKNTTTPGTGNLWQKVIYKVASADDAKTGTSTDTIITPAVLKTEADRRETVINQSITSLTDTVNSNKSTQDQINQATNETIAQNYKDTNQSIAAINQRKINGKTFNGDITLTPGDVKAIPLAGSLDITGTLRTKGSFQAQGQTGLIIAPGGATGSSMRWHYNNTAAYLLFNDSGDAYGAWNEKRPFIVYAATGNTQIGFQLQVLGQTTFDGNVIANKPASFTSTLAVKGATTLSSTLSVTGEATAKKVTPSDYSNFDSKYAGTLKQGDNGYWRDNNTGFVCMWGTIPSLSSGWQTVNFHTAFSTCFSVSAVLRSVNEESTRNLIVGTWTATGFQLYAQDNEKSAAYQAFGIISG